MTESDIDPPSQKEEPHGDASESLALEAPSADSTPAQTQELKASEEGSSKDGLVSDADATNETEESGTPGEEDDDEEDELDSLQLPKPPGDVARGRVTQPVGGPPKPPPKPVQKPVQKPAQGTKNVKGGK